jgi:hypothetical protein
MAQAKYCRADHEFFSLALARKNQRPKPGDPKREQKTIARANKYD